VCARGNLADNGGLLSTAWADTVKLSHVSSFLDTLHGKYLLTNER
jgi:hypothetical protein